ncbi:MAG TPA: carbamate kinase [Longimicrobiales bacterium]|nr:carbamate kinase [Longimicrobiales bacterium]
MGRRVVVGLGGNALMRRGEDQAPGVSAGHLARAADVLAEVARDHTLVVTHGNGPQVGLLALQADALANQLPTPLDVLGAESEGMLGYLVERELRTRLPQASVAALLTQVQVDPMDPAFRNPTKPIGPVYSEREARDLSRARGWHVGRDGDHWRRLVPSPVPLRILEAETLALLVDHGVVVVCAGGGGIPVTVDEAGWVRGVEAVVDKDLTAALLARTVSATGLVLLTDVPGVMEGWGTDAARLIPRLTVEEARAFPAAAGSMGPKLRACADFVAGGGEFAAIGALEDGLAVVEGRAGTRIAEE